MAFPLNPIVNQEYVTALGTVYKYNATGMRWDLSSTTLTGATGVIGPTGAMGLTGLYTIREASENPTGAHNLDTYWDTEQEALFARITGSNTWAQVSAGSMQGAQGETGVRGPTGPYIFQFENVPLSVQDISNGGKVVLDGYPVQTFGSYALSPNIQFWHYNLPRAIMGYGWPGTSEANSLNIILKNYTGGQFYSGIGYTGYMSLGDIGFKLNNNGLQINGVTGGPYKLGV